MARQFIQFGYRVDIVTRRFEKQPEFDPLSSSSHVWRIPFSGKLFVRKEDMHDHIENFVVNFLAEVRKRHIEYDVVMSHYWDAGWAGQQIAEELHIPHIHTPHSLGWWKQQQMSKNMEKTPEELEKTYRFNERLSKEFHVYRNCDHIIATTHEQSVILQQNYDILPKQITIIPAGIDEQRFSQIPNSKRKELQQKLGFGEKDVFAVGRMAANKGFDLLIKAMKVVIQSVPNAHLILAAGSGAERDNQKLEELLLLIQQLEIKEQIKIQDYIPDADLADYYRCAGVFALSSLYEPFGMTAVEAMSCGTPTVVTTNGGLHKLIDFGTQALYANPENSLEFGTMLSLPLLYPQLADELSLEGARFARRNFSWSGIAKRTLELVNYFRGRYNKDTVTSVAVDPMANAI
jgi:mannosylfructose-phosphate synthase